MKYEGKLYLQSKNKKRKQKLKEQGITLIALVVTIILLLILAGVTISQIVGSNGLFQRAREAVEKYKNAAEEEQIQIGMLEQYVTDFSVIGGNEGEDKASVDIKKLEVTGDIKNKQITVKVTVQGESTGVEYKINSDENWTERQTDGTVKEGTEGEEKETEYTYTFGDLALGKGYYVRVKAYDTDEKYIEVTSDVVTLNNVITAKEEDVLSPKTYLAEDGSVKTGTMKDKRGQILEAKTTTIDGEYAFLTIPENGYYDTNSKIKCLNNNMQVISDRVVWFGDKDSVPAQYNSDEYVKFYTFSSASASVFVDVKGGGDLSASVSYPNTSAKTAGNDSINDATVNLSIVEDAYVAIVKNDGSDNYVWFGRKDCVPSKYNNSEYKKYYTFSSASASILVDVKGGGDLSTRVSYPNTSATTGGNSTINSSKLSLSIAVQKYVAIVIKNL